MATRSRMIQSKKKVSESISILDIFQGVRNWLRDMFVRFCFCRKMVKVTYMKLIQLRLGQPTSEILSQK